MDAALQMRQCRYPRSGENVPGGACGFNLVIAWEAAPQPKASSEERSVEEKSLACAACRRGGQHPNLDVHARRKAQALVQGLDGLDGRLQDVDQPFVGADLELLARFSVDVRT